MVDNPILYRTNGKPSRNWRYHSSSNSGSSNSSREAGLAPPTESAIGRFGVEDTTNAPISCGRTEPELLLHWVKPRGATGYVRARIM